MPPVGSPDANHKAGETLCVDGFAVSLGTGSKHRDKRMRLPNWTQFMTAHAGSARRGKKPFRSRLRRLWRGGGGVFDVRQKRSLSARTVHRLLTPPRRVGLPLIHYWMSPAVTGTLIVVEGPLPAPGGKPL